MKTLLTALVMVFTNFAFSQWCNKPNPNFCPGNFFQNGDFETVTGDPNSRDDEDINIATGWQAMWGGTSLADLHCTGASISTGTAPTPNTNVYAGIWVENRPTVSGNADFREGMYNRLSTPIGQNTGNYSFNFKIANSLLINSNPVKIGVYGVYNPNNVIAAAPIGANSNPTNINLWQSANNAVKVVLLGSITTPNNFSNTWMPQTVSFNSSILPSGGITHIMITADDSARPTAYAKLYINFDEFCLQKATPPITFDPCCPPMNASLMNTLFKLSPTGTISDPYKLTFASNSAFTSTSQAYLNYIQSVYPGINRLTYSWELRKAGTGANPQINYSQPVGPNPTVYNWFVPNGNGVIHSQTAFFDGLLNNNEWYAIHVGIFTEPSEPNAFKAVECSSKTIIYIRVQVANGMRKASISDGKKILNEYNLGGK